MPRPPAIGAHRIDDLPGASEAELLVAAAGPGPEAIKLFPCLTQLSMKFFVLINVKMPTIVGILTFMSGKKCILCLSEPRNSRIS